MIQKSENFLNINNVRIIKWTYSYKGYASSYNVEILNYFNPELPLRDTEFAIKSKPLDLLTQLKGFKFVTTLALALENIESDGKTKYDTLYSHLKAEPVINESSIDYVFESIYTANISNIQKSLGKGLGWII